MALIIFTSIFASSSSCNFTRRSYAYIYVKTDEDQHVYTLTVFNNGRASLDVQSQNRERISFSGMMDFYSEEE